MVKVRQRRPSIGDVPVLSGQIVVARAHKPWELIAVDPLTR
jgi:hypothetical protein